MRSKNIAAKMLTASVVVFTHPLKEQRFKTAQCCPSVAVNETRIHTDQVCPSSAVKKGLAEPFPTQM
jgi:hypothetical protein